MQLATASAIEAPTTLAVCYRCSYQSSECASSCPRCSFPLITRSDMSPAGGIRLADVLNRDSIRVGAPRLPGVDAAPQKVQPRSPQIAPPPKAQGRSLRIAKENRPLTEEAVIAVSRGTSLWSLIFVCLSAVGLGVAAAAMQSSL